MACHFDEVNDDVQITDHAALTLPDGDWTIAGGIKLTDNAGTSYQYILSWGLLGASPSLNWRFAEAGHASANKLIMYLRDAGGDIIYKVSPGTPGTRTDWMHLILQRSGNTVTQYVDGVADGADTEALFDAVNVAGNLFFGSYSAGGANYFLGADMAKWAKWDRALSAGERAGLVKGFSPACYPGRVWHLDMVRPYRELIVPLTVTNNGTTVVPHPPTIYPFGAKVIVIPVDKVAIGRTHVTHPGIGLKLYVVNWRSNVSGDVELRFDGVNYPRLEGVVDRIITAPSVVAPPTNDYDLELQTLDGVDVLSSGGHDRSSTAVETIRPYHQLGASGRAEFVVKDVLVLAISNAGVRKRGEVIFYLLDP